MQRQNSIHPPPRSLASKPLFIWDNPNKVIDRNGRPVITTAEIWEPQDPSDNININWDTLKTAADIKDAIKCHVAYTIEAQAPKTAHQVFKQLKYCLVRLPPLKSVWDISYEILEAAIAQARLERKDWHFHYIRRWYRWCEDQDIPGFSGELASRLYRLKINGNTHGERVMTRDVNDGPLSHDEHFLIRRAVKEDKGRLVDRVIIMLLLELGARPVQLVQLEEQDFLIQMSPSGQPFYALNVPRAKQRNVGEAEKKRRRISQELGRLIENLIEVNHHKFGDQGAQMPLLCVRDARNKKLTSELKIRYALHMKVVGFGQRVRAYPASVNLISPRTGRIIKLSARRLRYTYFTMLAEQGTSTLHLAELADHSSDKSITIYVSSTSSVVDRLNAALGKDTHYANTIKRFLGLVVEPKSNERAAAVIFGSTPTLINLGGIGVCGADFLCNLYPPLSCYLCPKFQAWTDGPHEKLLAELETYVQQLVEGCNYPSDKIPYQLTEVIVSIRQLLERIAELKHSGKREKV